MSVENPHRRQEQPPPKPPERPVPPPARIESERATERPRPPEDRGFEAKADKLTAQDHQVRSSQKPEMAKNEKAAESHPDANSQNSEKAGGQRLEKSPEPKVAKEESSGREKGKALESSDTKKEPGVSEAPKESANKIENSKERSTGAEEKASWGAKAIEVIQKGADADSVGKMIGAAVFALHINAEVPKTPQLQPPETFVQQANESKLPSQPTDQPGNSQNELMKTAYEFANRQAEERRKAAEEDRNRKR